MKKNNKTTDLIPAGEDDTLNELFDIVTTGDQPKYLSSRALYLST